MIFQIRPDWSMHNRSIKNIEDELVSSFVWKGSGWYFTKTDTILILPATNTHKNNNVWTNDQNMTYNVHVWNSTGIKEMFEIIASGPVVINES
jgi:hypothetical protein